MTTAVTVFLSCTYKSLLANVVWLLNILLSCKYFEIEAMAYINLKSSVSPEAELRGIPVNEGIEKIILNALPIQVGRGIRF